MIYKYNFKILLENRYSKNHYLNKKNEKAFKTLNLFMETVKAIRIKKFYKKYIYFKDIIQ